MLLWIELKSTEPSQATDEYNERKTFHGTNGTRDNICVGAAAIPGDLKFQGEKPEKPSWCAG
jgi:hypothetical protein